MGYGDNRVYESNSSPTPYVTNSRFFEYCDYNLVKEVLCDIPGESYTKAQLITEGEEAYERLYYILSSCSGEVEMEALCGKLYSAESLNALTGNAKCRLEKLVSDLAIFDCYNRRDGQNPPQNVILRWQEAKKLLDRLRIGDMIFPFEETQEAGLPISKFITNTQQLQANRPSIVWSRFFGTRQPTRRGF